MQIQFQQCYRYLMSENALIVLNISKSLLQYSISHRLGEKFVGWPGVAIVMPSKFQANKDVSDSRLVVITCFRKRSCWIDNLWIL